MHKKAEGMGRELGLPPSQTLTAPVGDLRILSAHGHISILQISKGALKYHWEGLYIDFLYLSLQIRSKGKKLWPLQRPTPIPSLRALENKFNPSSPSLIIFTVIMGIMAGCFVIHIEKYMLIVLNL